MAGRRSNFVVFVELTYNNGVHVEEVKAADSYEAEQQVLEGICDGGSRSKHVRNSWVVRGTLC